MKIQVFESIEALAEASAKFIAEQAKAAFAERGQFDIALSGGSTPRATYSRMALGPFSNTIPWPRVHVFWSDERCAPPESPESNYRMARETMLQHLPIPEANIHRLQGELPPQEAATQANRELAAHSGEGIPSFDLILLGLGEDGHTASLFPGSAALKQSNELISANYVTKLDAWRLTFTSALINAARQILFMVSGESKAEAVKGVIEERDPALPATGVQPAPGNVAWHLDQAAASRLSRQTLGD
ncbi:MAG TPA: 6-phosphogluconolactonase [Anaerolineales bacterium]|nr:6-phosphogluconolactonase [Anaerolineales bacterium]